MSLPQKVLIVLLGAIGDVTRALPLAIRIKSNWPEVKLYWAIEPRSYEIIMGHAAIDQIIVFDRAKGLLAYLEFLKRLRSEKFDLVLDLQRHLKSGFTSYLTRAPRRIGFHPRNAKEFNWIFNSEYIAPVKNFSAKIWHYQLFGDQLGLEKTSPLKFGLQRSLEAVDQMDQKIKEFAMAQGILDSRKENRVALILGSTWSSRFWLPAYYRQLINELNKTKGVICLLIGGPGEKAFADQVISNNKLSAINIVGQTKLADLPAVFQNVKLAIGSDSGPMHIAAAVGTPVVSLWGSTSPLRSAPYLNEHRVIKSSLGCSPCYRENCPGLGTLCMKSITPNVVLEQVVNMFD